jgi:hypothetical protein
VIVRRILSLSGLGALLLLGGTAGLHSPVGTPVLRWLAGGSCPIGAELPAALQERVRLETLSAFLGDGEAQMRSVLGLELGITSRAQAEAWAAEQGLQCAAGKNRLECKGLPELHSVTLGFAPEGRLVGVDVAYSSPDATTAAEKLAERSELLASQAGEPASRRGEPTAAFLSQAPLRQAAASYRFSNYRVELTATNLGQGRFLVREFHQVL